MENALDSSYEKTRDHSVKTWETRPFTLSFKVRLTIPILGASFAHSLEGTCRRSPHVARCKVIPWGVYINKHKVMPPRDDTRPAQDPSWRKKNPFTRKGAARFHYTNPRIYILACSLFSYSDVCIFSKGWR